MKSHGGTLKARVAAARAFGGWSLGEATDPAAESVGSGDTAVGDPGAARPLSRARFAACDIVGRDSNAVL